MGSALSTQFADSSVNVLPIFKVGTIATMSHFIGARLRYRLRMHSMKANHFLGCVDNLFELHFDPPACFSR
jgi:hypothetical protein